MGYLLVVFLPTLLLSLYAQFRVKHAFSKYSKVRAGSGLTGAQAAAEMLRAAGLGGRVTIERAQGFPFRSLRSPAQGAAPESRRP